MSEWVSACVSETHLHLKYYLISLHFIVPAHVFITCTANFLGGGGGEKLQLEGANSRPLPPYMKSCWCVSVYMYVCSHLRSEAAVLREAGLFYKKSKHTQIEVNYNVHVHY